MPNKLDDIKLVLILALSIVLLRFLFVSPSIDVFDGGTFVLCADRTLETGSIVPAHEPGYTGYVALITVIAAFNKAFTGVAETDRIAVFISAILGSLSIIPLYSLAKDLYDKRTAILGSIFFIASPLCWIFSEIGMTDIPATFYVIASLSLLYRWQKLKTSHRYLIAASVLLGTSIAIRLTSALTLIAFLTVFAQLAMKKELRMTSVLALLIPIGTGVLAYLPLGGSGPSIPVFFINPWSWEACLVGLIDGLTLPIFLLTLTGIICLVVERRNMCLILASTVPYILIYNLRPQWMGSGFHARFLLPIYPVLVILAARPISVAIAKSSVPMKLRSFRLSFKTLATCVIVFTVVFATYSSFPIVSYYHNYPHWAVSLAEWYKENTPENAVILTSYDLRFVQYYANRTSIFVKEDGTMEIVKPRLLEWEQPMEIKLAQLTQLVESGVPVFLSSRIYQFERFLDVLRTKFVLKEVGSVTVDARRYWTSEAALDPVPATRELTTKWLIDSVDIPAKIHLTQTFLLKQENLTISIYQLFPL